ncbi:hypothetical protein TNIN_179121 [Trichonephila inaurata madagascariensis]|uniref:Uncharacterized protein n=1 Tax=Trichonephila inaurata madagascariensis TaxID=2747483 RepID=A0A8X6Y7B7_9ARAC|nr:hypothetical protein TNIN_179121 [Trichonephila inaurata madagascariensis]
MVLRQQPFVQDVQRHVQKFGRVPSKASIVYVYGEAQQKALFKRFFRFICSWWMCWSRSVSRTFPNQKLQNYFEWTSPISRSKSYPSLAVLTEPRKRQTV